MDHFNKVKRQILLVALASMLAVAVVSIVVFWLLFAQLSLHPSIAVPLGIFGVGIFIYLAADFLAHRSLQPLHAIWQAVLHVDPEHQGTPAPDLNKLAVGRELVTNLVLQIYQFASQQNSAELIDHRREISQAANVVSHLPLPLFVFNKKLLVTHASNIALEYCKVESSQLFGKPLFDALQMEFSTENTLDAWVAGCQKNKVTDTAYWERVHVLSPEGQVVRQCDIAASYNRDNPSGTEFIVTLFDRTQRYTSEDESLGFVALAVHELRTPITMLRGYIEVFEDELSGSLSDEHKAFVLKMDASAKHLSSFVSNILNVARIDQNQLSLHLSEQTWPQVLKASLVDAELRARVHGKTIEYHVADNLPLVAVDPVSIYEVLNNLLENAIKYSGESKQIVVSSVLNKDGRIETTVQDFGAGIPTSVLPNLFEKYARNHRSRDKVSGTGLGLYLAKSIISAHGGQIWASSKEGEGSTFGFTLLPYTQLSKSQKEQGNQGITRTANGWIKNHSLYRR